MKYDTKNSDILSYNPDLNINSKPNIDVDYGSDDNSSSESSQSTVVNQFEIHLPSYKIAKIIEIEKNVDNYMLKIKDDLIKDPTLNLYFTSDNDSNKDEILSKNSSSITGSTRLEVYKTFESIKDELTDVKDNFIYSIYGKDIDVDKTLEVDTEYLDKIVSYEHNDEHQYINYFNLYLDTQISFLVGEYASKVDGIVNDLSSIEDNTSTNLNKRESSEAIINSFNSNNIVLDSDIYKNTNVSKEINIALKNIFAIKQLLNLFIDDYSNYSDYVNDYEIIYQIRKENEDDLNEKLENLVKCVILSTISKDDIYKTIKKKSRIRDFFNM